MPFTGFTSAKGVAVPIDYNFRLLNFTPMIGELTMDQLGASAILSGSTPVPYVEHSIDTLNRFLTQRGGLILRQSPQDKIEVLPPGYDPSREMPYPRGQRPPAQQGGDVNVMDDEGMLDQLRKVNPFLMEGGLLSFDKNTKLAIYLFVIAVILIAAGVFSLR